MLSIKITNSPEIANGCTHGGIFHADEVIATIILAAYYCKNNYPNDFLVCRTFNVPEDLNPDAVVYDIGGGRFDHHQREGNGCRENGVPYSSAGLIWHEFGPKLVANTPNPDLVWKIVDRNIIQGIDAVDNGTLPKPDYPAEALSISRAISLFNPSWDSNEKSNEAFIKAVNFGITVLGNVLDNAIATAKAQTIVDEAISKTEGHVLVLEHFVPWQGALNASKDPKATDILFVVFPSLRGGFNWQCVPEKPGSFVQKKPVPAEWKGLKDTELQKVTGVATATFCHPAGFIGGAETMEDAIRLAEIAASK